MIEKRVQLWSCGGGRQSAGIAALIVQGRLPKPDAVCMAALEWERKATFRYVNAYIRPAMTALGIPFTFVSRKKYATVGFWSGADGDSITLPVYSDQSGELSKLPEYCSAEWKREVVSRWANERGLNFWPFLTHESPEFTWKNRGVDVWIGISWDERHRRRAARRKWLRPVYPLLDMLPKCVGVSACLDAVEEVGWPPPPRSRCYHCPNQSDREWAELTPDEWKAACDRDDEIRLTDPHAFLHKKMVPLRMVTLEPEKQTAGLFSGGCSAGMCY